MSRLPYLCVFLTLPVIALYSALRVKNQIVAAGMTWAALLLPPLLVMLWGQFVIPSNNIPDTWISAGFALADLAAGLAACLLLRHRLTREDVLDSDIEPNLMMRAGQFSKKNNDRILAGQNHKSEIQNSFQPIYDSVLP